VAIRHKRALISGLAGLAMSLMLFATESIHGIEPVTIALVGAVLALATSGLSHREMIDEVGLENVMAFVGLFVLAGAVTATGVLNLVLGILLDLYNFNPVLASLLFMTFIATVTAIIDAGPTAAAFTPLIASLESQVVGPPHFLWWTLSFGVLAGSSSTILGATAGQIAASQIEQYRLVSQAANDPEVTSQRKSRGFVRRFTLAGAPSGAIMIGLATVYLWVLFLTF
jgi:Na+/H+ antiporter NhaD/arsenite permease-like protein